MGMTDAGKLIETTQGTIATADGTRRNAYQNTYEVITFNADGSFAKTQQVRIEFLTFGNANAKAGHRWRKATVKQAETFVSIVQHVTQDA